MLKKLWCAHLLLLKSPHKHGKGVIPFIHFMHINLSSLFSSPNLNCTIKTQICQKMSLHTVLFLPYIDTSEKSHILRVCSLWCVAAVFKISAQSELQRKKWKIKQWADFSNFCTSVFAFVSRKQKNIFVIFRSKKQKTNNQK